MTLYATLADGKAELSASTTTADATLLNYLRIVSRRIDTLFQATRPFFAPYIMSRAFPVRQDTVNTWENTLRLRDNLLALTSISVSGTALTVGTQAETWPTLASPARSLRLMDYSNTWSDFCDTTDPTRPLFATVAGVWGYHSDYTNAWLAVTTLSAAVVSTTATSITVTDVDGTDAYGRTPWISAGALLQIDTEWMEVVSTSTTTNVCTVRRGVNGSTAATHLINAPVSVWQVEETIRRATARQASFMYARRGAYESANITDLGIVNFPSDLLAELRGILVGFAYE